MNENKNESTITLHSLRMSAGVMWMWRNAEGGRVSRIFRSEAEALRFKPGRQQ